MEFKLILFEGTDSIKFGMAREEIQSILKVTPDLVRSDVDIYDAELYPSICKVFYELNKNGVLVCAEIEFFKPTKVFLDGIQLMNKPIKEIEEWFKNKFEDATNEIMTGLMSAKYEIRLTVSDSSKIESVDLSRQGYQEQQKEFYEKAYDAKNLVENSTTRKYICLNCKDVVNSETPIVKCFKCNTFMIPK